MKRNFTFLVLSLFLLTSVAGFAQSKVVALKSEKGAVAQMRQSGTRLNFEFGYNEFKVTSTVAKTGDTYAEITIDGGIEYGQIGTPSLPTVKKLIQIPVGSNVSIKVNSYKTQEFSLAELGFDSRIRPVQPSLRKDQEVDELPFSLDEKVYSSDGFVMPDIASVKVLGVMRGVAIAQVIVKPVNYNPVRGVVQIYNDLDVEVNYDEASKDAQYLAARTACPYFDATYSLMANKIEKTAGDDYPAHPDLMKYPVRMLIISNRMFEATLQPFIEWKTMKGFNVEVHYTDVIGTSAAAIKTFIHGVYNAATVENPAPSFIVLVGDVAQLPASANGSQSQKMTDLYYASVDGDMFPEMYYGRMSAQTTAQLQIIIDKVLYYEKYEFEDPTYLNRATLIAGADGNWNPHVGQPTIKYGTANYFNSANGYTNVYEYGVSNDPNNSSESSGYTGCYTAEKLSVGYINYTAHCGETSWSDPNLTASTLQSANNTNKHPLSVGNCCLSGDFNTNECIGESWIRKANRGAVTYIGSSPSTYWYEDTYWAVGAFAGIASNPCTPTFANSTLGAYDAPTHSSYTSASGLIFAGNMAVTQAHDNNYPEHVGELYYWQAYNVLGDPSLVAYFTEGEVLDVSYNPIVFIGSSTFTVSAPNGSMVAISKDGVLHGAALVTSGNTVEVPITPITTAGNVSLVITRPQSIPVITTLPASAPDGAYITVDSCSVEDANGQADFGESFSVKVYFSNVGVESASNLTATVSGTDSYFTITNAGPATIGTIAADGATASVSNAFSFTLADNVPDQHSARFDVAITDGDSTWNSSFSLKANAPILAVELIEMQNDADDNGVLNVGENGEIKVQVSNTGAADANDVSINLSTNNSAVTVTGTNPIIVDIAAGSTEEVVFAVSAGTEIVDGTDVLFSVTGGLGDYELSEDELITIGNKPIIFIGEGTTNNTSQYPFGTYYKANRSQMLYLQSELGSTPRMISHLGFNFTTIGGNPVLTNLTIKVKEVSNTALGSSFVSTTDATVVLPACNYTMPTANGWYDFDVTDFMYSGTGNLLVEVSFGLNSSYTSNYNVACTATSFTSVNYGYDDNSASPSFDGSCSTRPNLKVTFISTSEVTFTVTDNSSNPIEGATIVVGEETTTTDAEGVGSLVIGNGSYIYSISKEGFATAEANITVNNDLQLEVTLYESHDVTFTVKHQDEAIEGAQIAINNKTYSTDANGVVTMGLASGAYPYTVTKDGYNSYNGNITVGEEDVEEEILMWLVGVEDVDINEVRLFPNPFTNSINIEHAAGFNRATITNSLGQIVLDVTLSGNEQAVIATGDLESGVYFITLRDNMGNSMIKKLVRR